MKQTLKEEAIGLKLEELMLPADYRSVVNDYLSPIADDLQLLLSAPNRCAHREPLILGIQGPQGSGKSTCSEFLKLLLAYEHQLNAVVLSMDDFYLSHEERKQLADKEHPLLKTRGVPGTHDIQLALDTINKLGKLNDKQSISVPRFDKSTDDRFPEEQWQQVSGPVDIIILEGWCVALRPQSPTEIKQAVNDLEVNNDPCGKWRNYINACLAGNYQELFSLIDKLIIFKPPSFDCVYQWRLKQEQKLLVSLANAGAGKKIRTFSPKELKHFIAHYQRLTEHALKTLPEKADWCISLDNNQQILNIKKR